MARKWYRPIIWAPEKRDTLPMMTCTESDLKDWDWTNFQSGERIVCWDGGFWFRVATPDDEGEPADALATHLHMHIHSPRLQAALAQASVSGIQYLPIRVLHFDGSEVPGYCIAHVLNLVAALDLERSICSRFGDERPDRRGEIKAPVKIVLKGTEVKDHDVIRLKEFPMAMCVSERFQKTFQTGRFRGYYFAPVGLS